MISYFHQPEMTCRISNKIHKNASQTMFYSFPSNSYREGDNECGWLRLVSACDVTGHAPPLELPDQNVRYYGRNHGNVVWICSYIPTIDQQLIYCSFIIVNINYLLFAVKLLFDASVRRKTLLLPSKTQNFSP